MSVEDQKPEVTEQRLADSLGMMLRSRLKADSRMLFESSTARVSVLLLLEELAISS